MNSLPKLLIASHNKGKIAEFKRIFKNIPVTLVTMDDVGITYDVEETGTTFQENAMLKARTYAELSGLPTLSDDGGLEVAALGGQPGVYSSRYAGPNKTDAQKVAFLLEKLKDVPEGKRQARFVGVLALARGADDVSVYVGILPGSIALEARGTPKQQLPYRQIFIPEGFDKTFDELDDLGIVYTTHRDKAFELLLKDLQSNRI